MTHSSQTKSSISIDLFNLPPCLTQEGNLQCYVNYPIAYGTKYYVINQVNGQINTIHDNNIELTEFTGHFSPFNLDELELKVCRLADHQEDEDVFSAAKQPPKWPVAPQA